MKERKLLRVPHTKKLSPLMWRERRRKEDKIIYGSLVLSVHGLLYLSLLATSWLSSSSYKGYLLHKALFRTIFCHETWSLIDVIRLATLPIPTSWVVTWCSILFLNFLLHLATRETYVGMLQCMIPVIILVSLFVVFKPTYDKVRCFIRNYWQFCLGSN